MNVLDFWKNEWGKVTDNSDVLSLDSLDVGGNSFKQKRPQWSDVYRGYPKTPDGMDDMDSKEVFEKILLEETLKKYPSTFVNACATRVSLGLIEGGMRLQGDFRVQKGDYEGSFFIASAQGLYNFLHEKAWGKPDEEIKNPSNLNLVSKKIKERNGVYIILGAFTGGVTGHATLWIGSKGDVVGGHNYIDGKGTVYFWELW